MEPYKIDYNALVFGTLAEAQRFRELILADREFSDEGKRRKIEAHVTPRLQSAAESAAHWLAQLEREGERAEAELARVKHDRAMSVNTDRRDYHRRRLDDVLKGDWEQVRTAIDTDLQASDLDALAVWSEKDATLRAKFDRGGGPESVASTGLWAYRGKVTAAIAAAEPSDVRQAEAELTRIADELFVARSRLSSADRSASMRGETPPFKAVLNPPGKVVVRGGPDDPNGEFYITTEGGKSIW